MQALPTTLKLYLKLAVDRRQILARHLAVRIAFGAMSAIVLLVGVALLNVSLFLVLRPLLGDLQAVLMVALLHFVIGGGLAVYALREPASAELTALAEAEAAALAALGSQTEGTVSALAAAERRIESIGQGLSLTASALPSLIGLLSRNQKSQDKPADAVAPDVPGDKT